MPSGKSKPTTAITPLVTGLDQPRRIPGLKKVLSNIDLIMDKAIKSHNPAQVYDLLDDLAGAENIVGISKAKALWTARENWGSIGVGSGGFEDEIYTNVGLSKSTVQRYVDVWDMFEGWKALYHIEDEVQEKLLGRPIADLIAVSQHQNEHGVLHLDEIIQVVDATDNSEVRRLLRVIRGEDPNEGTFSFHARRDGTLEAWEDGRIVSLGYIRLDAESRKDPLRAKALAKLLKRARIMEE